jgi:hypothetical protein
MSAKATRILFWIMASSVIRLRAPRSARRRTSSAWMGTLVVGNLLAERLSAEATAANVGKRLDLTGSGFHTLANEANNESLRASPALATTVARVAFNGWP